MNEKLFWFYNLILPLLLVALFITAVAVGFSMPDYLVAFLPLATAAAAPAAPTATV